MPGFAAEVLGAMITPAVLISASGTLVLSTSNRLGRVVDRVRALSVEVAQSGTLPSAASAANRASLIARQLDQLAARAIVLRRAMTSLYAAISLLVATSISVGAIVLSGWSGEWLAVALALSGACALMYGSFLLVREARLAIVSTLDEMAFAREVAGGPQSRNPAV